MSIVAKLRKMRNVAELIGASRQYWKIFMKDKYHSFESFENFISGFRDFQRL